MKNLKAYTSFFTALLIFLIPLSCKDLNVVNENEPDLARSLANPADVESIIGSTFLTYWQAIHRNTPSMAISALADELSSSWCMGTRFLSSEPRETWNNDPSFPYNNVTETPWYNAYEAISTSIDGLVALEKGIRIIEDNGNDNTVRAKAFAKFVMGLSYGLLGCYFDQAFILDESTDLETDQLEPKPHTGVVNAAVGFLEDCINLCENSTFILPDIWINGLALDQHQLQQLAHSYIARILASAGRNVAERDAADWQKIKYHADRGITWDFAPIGDGNFWWKGNLYYGQRPLWSRSDYKTIGWADTSGAHDAWMATPVADRNWFLIHTDDRRITGGAPLVDGTDFAYAGESNFRQDRGTYHFSGYVYKRYLDYYLNGATGPMYCFLITELNLLKAEYHVRQGDAVSAAAEINKTKVTRGGLAPASAANGIGSVDDSRNPRGSLWAQLKYEKGVECYIAQALGPYYDRRGWGELVTNSPIHFPIPGKDLEILFMDNYTFGGGGPGSAAKRLSTLQTFTVPDCF